MPKKQVEAEHPGLQVEGNDTTGYVGVDPIYQNYANETEAPLVGEGEEDGYAMVKDHMESLQSENYRGKSATATHPSDSTPLVAASK